MAAAKAYFTDRDTFNGYTTALASAYEPSLRWAAAGDPGTASQNIAIVTASGNSLLLVRASQAGTYFCAVETAGVSRIARDDAATSSYANVNTVAECAALPAA